MLPGDIDLQTVAFFLSGRESSRGNRLQYYEIFDAEHLLTETVWYLYCVGTGNPRWVVRKRVDSEWYEGTQFGYTDAEEVWMIARNAWKLNGNGSCGEKTTGSVVEVRGSGRARRMVRRSPEARSPALPIYVY